MKGTRYIALIVAIFAFSTPAVYADTLLPSFYTTDGSHSAIDLNTSASIGANLQPVFTFDLSQTTTITGFWLPLQRWGGINHPSTITTEIRERSGSTLGAVLGTGNIDYNNDLYNYQTIYPSGSYTMYTFPSGCGSNAPTYYGGTSCFQFFPVATTTLQAGSYAVQVVLPNTTTRVRVSLYAGASNSTFYTTTSSSSAALSQSSGFYAAPSGFYAPFAIQGTQAATPTNSGGIMGSTSAKMILAGTVSGVQNTFQPLAPIFAVIGIPIAFHIGRAAIVLIAAMF